MTRALLFSALVASTVPLAAGYLLRGLVPGAALVLLLGLFWLVGIVRRWAWVSPTLFLLLGIFNALVFLIQAHAFLVLISLPATLAAWDLNHFLTRLEMAKSPDLRRAMENNHLPRLGLILLAGILPAGAAMLSHIQLAFVLAFVLGGIAVLALNQVIHRLVNREPSPPKHSGL
jgi:hypothetical protein